MTKKKFITITIGLFIAAVLVAAGLYVYINSVMAQSGSAPAISDVSIVDVGDDSVRIQWETDKNADSMINFGLDRRFGLVRDPDASNTEHEIFLEDLSPATRYFFRAVSVDQDGNQGISGSFSFRTGGEPDVEEIVDRIGEITDEDSLVDISDAIREAAEGLSDELTIVGPPRVEEEVFSATISWETNRPSDSQVFFAPEDQYDPSANDPYTFSQSGVGGETTDHSIDVIGLEPFTTYHFKVQSSDQFGMVGESIDSTFTTKALLPDIQELQIVKVEEETATLAWNTTVPSAALVEYEDLVTGQQFSKGSPALTTQHTIQLDGLEFGSRYRAVAVAESEGGETVRSAPIEFVTILDEEPPIISRVTNESTLYPGVETRVQTIITWETDESSLCNVFHREGISPGVEPTETPPRDADNYITDHVRVFVDFRPATVYQFWLECEDRAGNEDRSENFVLFTPQQEKSIIDIILENFEGTFGWIANMRN